MELFQGINATIIAWLTLAIIGIVKIYSSLTERDYKAAGKIAVAAISGALLIPFAAEAIGMTAHWFVGMLVGFSGAGVITTAPYIGSRSAVQVDKANVINTESISNERPS
jgi:hypothetical protein